MVLFTIESLFNFSTTVARLWLLSGWLLWCLAATALVATSCSSRSVSGSSATAAAPVTSTSSPTPAFWAVAARRIPLFFASSWTYFWWEDLLFTCVQLSGCGDFLFTKINRKTRNRTASGREAKTVFSRFKVTSSIHFAYLSQRRWWKKLAKFLLFSVQFHNSIQNSRDKWWQ